MDLNDVCKTTILSVRGNLYLFLIDNKEMIDRFAKELRNNGYDDSLVENFLIAQNLDRDVKSIEENVMTVDFFLEFCGVYDIYSYVVDSEISENKSGYGRVRGVDSKK